MMRFNIFHRPGTDGHYDIYRKQQALAHDLGLKTTVFLFYRDLFDKRAIADAITDRDTCGDEIALSLHGLSGPGLSEITSGQICIWLLDRERKEQALALILAKFREVFGSAPASVGSYHFDSSSLAILKKLAPEVKTVIGGCFEEGVRVFHGCNHSWYLFNEGMPWNPWFPSNSHTLRPAQGGGDSSDIVAVPHLLRDMSLSFEGRNDFWASHSPNVIRGMGNDASFCPYDLNLVDQFRMQEEWNGGHSYYNTFVSPSWLDWNHNSEYPPEVAWELYEKFLRYMADLKKQGELIDLTLAEYGQWHRTAKPAGTPEVYLAKEMLYGSGKHYFWYCDPAWRVTINADQGGSIGDLRPYAGRVAVATGPDTPHRDIGTYPYLIQSQHRTGNAHHCYDGARTTLLLVHGDEILDLCNFSTKVAAITRTDDATEIRLTPVAFKFAAGLTGSLVTTYRFSRDGVLHIARVVSELSDPQATLESTEYFKGAPGRTEYPEDLHGILLEADGATPVSHAFDYDGAWKESAGARCVAAVIPQVNSRLELSVASDAAPATTGGVCAGHLFSPYFTLKLTRSLRGNGTLKSCLKIIPSAM